MVEAVLVLKVANDVCHHGPPLVATKYQLLEWVVVLFIFKLLTHWSHCGPWILTWDFMFQCNSQVSLWVLRQNLNPVGHNSSYLLLAGSIMYNLFLHRSERASITTNHHQSNENCKIITTSRARPLVRLFSPQSSQLCVLFSSHLTKILPTSSSAADKMFVFLLEMIFELDIGNMQR